MDNMPRGRALALIAVALASVGGCGGAERRGDAGGKAQDSENTEEGLGHAGGGDGPSGPVEPADHDIEVPPAP